VATFYVDGPRELGDLAVKKHQQLNIRRPGTTVPGGLININNIIVQAYILVK